MRKFHQNLLSLGIVFQLCILIQLSEAGTVRITRKIGESLKVTCPKLTEGELRAMSFIRQGSKTYTTIYSKLANKPLNKLTGTGNRFSLDSTQRVMTVSRLSMGDDGMTFSCKLVSLRQELQNSVHVTIIVPPVLSISLSPTGPFRNSTSVTVVCEVQRVNPPLKGNKVTLTIGGETYDITTVRQNPDKTWHYKTTRSYYVTKARDNQKLIKCGAKTKGVVRKLEKTKRLQFIRPPKGTPKITASTHVIRTGEDLILRCTIRDLGIPSTNTYLFYQNGKLVKRNGPYSKLTVKVTSDINSGSYSCKVANSEGASVFSNSICIAHTNIALPGGGIPLWLSVTSILLNIAALVYICMFYVKPRVLKFWEDWRNRSKGKNYTKDGFQLNKEENQIVEKVPKGVKVMYDDKPPFDISENRGFSIAKLPMPKTEMEDETKESPGEVTEVVTPEPLPEPPEVKDPRAPLNQPSPTQAYEDLQL